MSDINGHDVYLDDLLMEPSDTDGWDEEAEKDHWNGIGSLTIFVTLVIPEEDIFEYELLDYSGCMGGAQETLGIDYLLKDMWCVWTDLSYPLKEGYEYTFHDISVHWTRGDGWTTDDDVDYYMGPISYKFRLIPWFHTKVKALWWKHIGWRLKS